MYLLLVKRTGDKRDLKLEKLVENTIIGIFPVIVEHRKQFPQKIEKYKSIRKN